MSEQAYDIIDGGIVIIDGGTVALAVFVFALAVFVFYGAEHEAQELAAVMGDGAFAAAEDPRHLCRRHSAADKERHMPVVDTEPAS